ncbi:MAG: hypothetical protein ABFS28_08670 [Bacteroidota bacterium]
MNRFIKNTLLLAFPFGLYLIIIVLMDPFNYLNMSMLVDESHKENVAQNVEQHLYRMIQFENTPRQNVSLGDSRANNLYIALDHDRWANLSYGGASLKETIETFWWSAEKFKLDTVLIAVNFNNYNKYNKRFWVEETLKIKKNLFSYAFSKHTFMATVLILKGMLTKREVSINKVTLDREEFWKAQITSVPRKFFTKYAYPENYYKDLKRISEHCVENSIKLILWIPPTVVDFQSELEKYALGDEEEIFRADMRSIGEVYDFNYLNEITENRDCFRDPLHVKNATAALISNEILGNKPVVARYSKP